MRSVFSGRSKRSLSRKILLFLSLLCFLLNINPHLGNAGYSQAKFSKPNDFAPGQIIVKFREDADIGVVAGELLRCKQKFETITKSSGLDRLNKKFKVKKMKKFFRIEDYNNPGSIIFNQPQASSLRKKSKIEFLQQADSIKQRFLKRTKRIPKNTKVPYLGHIYRVEFEDSKIDIKKACVEYAQDPDVEYAEPNYLAHTNYTPSDPFYPQQWSHQNTQAELGWDIETGSSNIIIAVVDTGVAYAHGDLAGNMLGDCNGGCPAGQGYDFVDIDTQSYINDGYELIPGEDYTTIDDNPSDYNGHGTHCAGIAAGVGDNGIGISGVCMHCSLMPIRAGFSILDNSVEYGVFEYDDLSNAIVYAADNGADIVSMSFGGPDSQTMSDAIDYAYAMGVVLVAAAGNDNTDSPSYPAGYPNVISVAATAQDDSKAYYSNYGDWVDVAAPGGDTYKDSMILSTVPTAGGEIADPSGYNSIQGTSMAAPYVAGNAGLILSKDPAWTNEEVKEIIRMGVDPISSPYDMGRGRVNIRKALEISTLPARILTVTVPNSAKEGDGVLTDAGIVSVNEAPLSDLVVDLVSDDTSEVEVPSNVTIFSGETTASFDLTIIDDGVIDVDQSVNITASASGWVSGSNIIVVSDAYQNGSEFQINTYTSDNQSYPSAAGLENGGFVVTWHSWLQDGSYEGIYAQVFDSSGNPINGEFKVNTSIPYNQLYSSVAGLEDGGFVVSWQSKNSYGGNYDIYAQVFDSSGSPLGGEFKVNTYTFLDQENPSATGLEGGGFVISWQSWQDGNRSGIYAQVFDNSGNRAGGEFQINTYTYNDQESPSAAGLAGGGFVVTWESDGQDGSGQGIYARVFDSTGNPLGGEFKVNTYTPNGQYSPSVAGLEGGGFVVSWYSYLQDGSGYGIYAQVFDSAGNPVGDEFQVNTYTSDSQISPSVSGLEGGGFVVTWESDGQDGSSNGIYAQVFDSSGNPEGIEFQVNTYISDSQSNPSTTGLEGGGFVVAWESYEQDGSDDGIYAQMFTAGSIMLSIPESINEGDGILAGQGIVRVASAPLSDLDVYLASSDTSELTVPDIVTIPAGQTFQTFDLTVIDDDLLDGPQKVAISSSANGYPSRLSTTLVNDNEPAVISVAVPETATEGDGTLTDQGIVTVSAILDSDVALRLTSSDMTEVSVPRYITIPAGQDSALFDVMIVDDLEIDGSQMATITASVTGWSSGYDTIDIEDNDTALTVDVPTAAKEGDGVLSNAGIVSVNAPPASDLVVDLISDDTSEVVVPSNVTISSGQTIAHFDLTIIDDEVIDGDQSVTVTASASGWVSGSDTIIVSDGFRNGPEFQVNTYTGSQQSSPSAAGLEGGGFVVIWYSLGQDGSGFGIYAQVFDNVGNPFGSEFQVNTYTNSHQSSPSVTDLEGGGFVVSWNSDGQDGSGTGIYAQIFDSLGDPVGDEFQVNTYTSSYQSSPSVTGLEGGGFVVSWNSDGQDGSGYGIYAQVFDSSGNPVGDEFQVNTYTSSYQISPWVTDLEGDGFVVSWESYGQDGSGYGIYAQVFDSSGNPVGGEFQVNTYTSLNQSSPSAAGLEGGGFVVSWNSDGQDGNDNGVYAQVFDSAGNPVGDEFQVNTYTYIDQKSPSVTGLEGGGFVVTWHSDGQDGSGKGIYAQVFDSSRNPEGMEFQINTYTSDSQSYPSAAGLEGGGFVVSWQSDGQDGSGDGVFGQILITDPIVLSIPESINEGDGILAGQGVVSVASAPLSDLDVNLVSSDTSELIVPDTITIPAGQTFQTFDLTVIEDDLLDGPQKVVVSCSADGYPSRLRTTLVNDNDSEPPMPVPPKKLRIQ